MNITRLTKLVVYAVLAAAVIGLGKPAFGGPEEADKLKTTLTPFGGDKAASSDGQIPSWTGAVAPSSFRQDPYAKESPILTITAANMDKYADKLSEGERAMLKKYADYSIVVYPTHRSEAAPQWVYDATYQNAVHAKMNGFIPQGAYGGVPFPIPKTRIEAMWNHLLRWKPSSWQRRFQGVQTTADGRHNTILDATADHEIPYYLKGEAARFSGDYFLVRVATIGPPIHAGEAIVGRQNINDEHSRSWIYFAGQRRTRELPNACCDTPTPATGGVMTFDELENFSGRPDRYDWKLGAKKEMYVPYNDSALNQVASDALLPHFVNPQRVRFELHRVWQVEGTLRAGQRHQSPRVTFYLDEDSWMALLADRYDAHNQLWKTGMEFPVALSEGPVLIGETFGEYDLLSGAWFINGLMNSNDDYFKISSTPLADDNFLPGAMLRGAR